MIGKEIYSFAKTLWPINRSLTGEGVRKTLFLIKNKLPELKILKIKSGTKVFDWVVPNEWNVREAWIKDPKGKKICNFNENNLHLMGYSQPIHKKINLEKLKKNLHSLKKQPTAIPYITSYYKKNWGFCISHNEKKKLKKGIYEVFIDSKFTIGNLNYGELIIKGKSKKEIFLSTNICHPSMGNNELSGMCVTTYLAKWIRNLKKTNYTYRIIFIPETIGAIAYLFYNLKSMKKNIIAGFNVVCIGDNYNYSYVPSRYGDTYSDLVAKHILKNTYPKFKTFSWLQRGGDERQYCAPKINLPVVSIMRSKYETYEEYHTSLDNLNFISSKGLEGGFNVLMNSLICIENNFIPIATNYCEPQLSKRGLYWDVVLEKNKNNNVKLLVNFLSLSDGKNSILDIANICQIPIWELYKISEKLLKNKLIRIKKLH